MDAYKFIACADVHLGFALYHIPELEKDLYEIFDNIIDIGIQHQINYLVIVGDLFHDNKPTPYTIQFVRDRIEKAKKHNIQVLGISGDHDKPVQGITWSSVSTIQPVSSFEFFAGIDFSSPGETLNYLQTQKNRDKTHWIFLHGQEISLFDFVAEHKKLDFRSFPLFELYPQLKGIILGDIHIPYETVIKNAARSCYLGYCGSPGVLASNEIGTKKGLLYWDGSNLSRIPLILNRDFYFFELNDVTLENFDFNQIKTDKPKKPIFRLRCSKSIRNKLTKLQPFYDIGYVEISWINDSDSNAVNLRSELKLENNIKEALKAEVQDEELFNLCYDLVINPDNAMEILTKFKNKYLIGV